MPDGNRHRLLVCISLVSILRKRLMRRIETGTVSCYPRRWLVNCFGQVIQEGGGSGAIGGSVITGESHGHHGTDSRLAIDGDHAVSDTAYRENRRLRRDNNRCELVHMIHAEIADGEGGIGDVGGAQLFCPRSLCHVATLLRNFRKGRGV